MAGENSVKTAQVLVTINGKSLTLSNFKKHVVSLKVKRVEGDKANSFTLEVFDKSAWDVEALLASTKEFTGTYQAMIGISYSNSFSTGKSKSFTGLVDNYNLTFVGSATMLSITGIVGESVNSDVWFTKQAIQWVDTTAVSPLNRKEQLYNNGFKDVYDYLDDYLNPPDTSLMTDDEVKSYLENRPKNPYPNMSPIALYRAFWSVDGKGENYYQKYESDTDICAILDWSQAGSDDISAQPRVLVNPSNIFIRIMKKYRGEIGGQSNTESIGPYVKPQKTLWVEGIETTQTANQTAANYIQNVLCKAAVLDTGDTSTMTAGFTYYVDGQGHHFEPIDWSGGNANKIAVGYNQHNSNIIAFSFDQLGALVMAQSNTDENGEPLLASSAMDYYTGSMITSNLSAFGGYGVTESTDANGNITTVGNWYFTKYSTIRIASSQSQSALNSNVSADFSEIEKLCFSASMTVWADDNSTYSPRKIC